MAFDPLAMIRKRSREEWLDWACKYFDRSREWLQSNGELALIFGVLAGIVLVLAIRIILVLLVLFALAAGVIWFVALPEGAEESNSSNEDQSFDDSSE